MNRIKLAICDDHAIFADGLKGLLMEREDIEIVGIGYDGTEIQEMIKEQDIDVILLDIEMPQLNGIELSAWLGEHYPQTEVIALTMFDEGVKIAEMVKAGVKGYLVKSANISEVVEAIQTVYRGERYSKGEVLNKIVELNTQPEESDPSKVLTRREKEILILIAKGASSNEISESLHISIHTVNSHKKNILKKLKLKNTAALVGFAYKHELISL